MSAEQDLRMSDVLDTLTKIHINYLKDLSLAIILREDEELNNCLFEYLLVLGNEKLIDEVMTLSLRHSGEIR